MEQRVKRRVGRPPGRTAPRRPVVSARVPETLYATIRGTAKTNNRTMGEEIIRRVEQSFEWEKAFGDTKALLAKATKTAGDNLQAAMRAAGYRRVRSMSGHGAAWFEPGVDAPVWILDSLDRDLLDELLKRAGMAALKAAREEAQS